MNDYKEVRVNARPCDEMVTDVIAALLAEIEYESFIPDENGITAYVKNELYDENALRSVLDNFPIEGYALSYEQKFIEGQDWNSEWEKNFFKPIVIADKCVIHSSFHTDFPQCEYDIVIDPKMAFGTGHHATTSQMVQFVIDNDMQGKRVMDMGTGTGILAILAAMRGAMVDAVEIDEPAYENALENVRLNGHPEINVMLGDASLLPAEPVYDVLLANINRNIILRDLPAYASAVKSGGRITLSGFYREDIPMLMDEACRCGLEHVADSHIDNWACLKLVKRLL